MKKQALALIVGGLLAPALPAYAEVGPLVGPPAASAAPSSPAGFYGGVALRDSGTEGNGVTIGPLTSVWGKFTPPGGDDAATRSLLFGGYRFANDLALEASFATSDGYALRPANGAGRGGVGLSLVPADQTARAWNADVYTSWSFLHRFALYGRLGYAQSDSLYGVAPADPRRARDGVNYGVGLRYDFNPALGLRVEYARFNRFAGEALQGSGPLPETDQVQLGVQLRF